MVESLKFGQIKIKLANDVPCDVHQQGWKVGVEESIERSSGAVIVQTFQLVFAQLQQFGDERGGPLPDAIQGFSAD